MTKQLKVDSVVNLAGSGKPNFPVSPTSEGAALSTLNTHSYTSSATEPSSPKNGAIWWDSANSKVYVYANGEFKEITLNTDYPSAYNPFFWGGDRGVFAGGYSTTFLNRIDYVNITSAGNAIDFGDLSDPRNGVSATASTTRSVFAQGWNGSVYSNVLDYITTATTGNATDFGDYSVAMSNSARGVTSDGTTGLFQGGWPTSGSARSNVIHKITIATTGNTTDFGDLSVPRMKAGAAGDATRGLCSSGNATVSGSNSNSNVIDYVTIATPGNATDFGDGTLVRTELMGASDTTRSLFAGGYGDGASSERVTIDYVTTQTTGNATDFGDLTGQRFDGSASSNGTKALFTGYFNSATSNVIDQVTIQTTGNATDFGDLTHARYGLGGASGTAS